MLNRLRSAIVRWLAPEIILQIETDAPSEKQVRAMLDRQQADFARRLPSLVVDASRRRA